ncbi:MAG TPA: sugar porter family MFS transporter [Steroidobacteraceae bacterium]
MSNRATYVWLVSAVAALGGLLFGYDWVVIGGAKPFYEAYFQLSSEAQIGWANSCALLGCLMGSIACGALSDRFGRKRLMIASGFLFVVSSIYTGWAQQFSAFVAWRIVGGVAIGMASNLSPMYIAEISPAPWRGRLVSLNQLAIVVGILAAQIVNWSIAQGVPDGASAETIRLSWNGQLGWRWMFTAVAAPSLVYLLSAWFIPESPRWLAKSGNADKAHEILARIGGADHALQSLVEIRGSLDGEERMGAAWREILAPGVVRILLTGVGLAVLQQWSGINVIFNYAEEIYRNAGYGVNDVLFNIVVTGALNLAFTLVALAWVDRLGRRALMLYGCAGIALSHILLGCAYAAGIKGIGVLVLTLCTIGCYALSLAPVTWVLISEIFPNRIRGLAVSVSVSALWVACFLVTFTFPILNHRLGAAKTFWTYGAVCLVGFLFILLRVPETKGRTLEQIEREFALWQFKNATQRTADRVG